MIRTPQRPWTTVPLDPRSRREAVSGTRHRLRALVYVPAVRGCVPSMRVAVGALVGLAMLVGCHSQTTMAYDAHRPYIWPPARRFREHSHSFSVVVLRGDQRLAEITVWLVQDRLARTDIAGVPCWLLFTDVASPDADVSCIPERSGVTRSGRMAVRKWRIADEEGVPVIVELQVVLANDGEFVVGWIGESERDGAKVVGTEPHSFHSGGRSEHAQLLLSVPG